MAGKKEAFERLYGSGGDIRSYFAPGRVNLIGEHTDYNGGHVFPCALTMGIRAWARRRQDDQMVRLYSENFPKAGVKTYDLSEEPVVPAGEWTAYPMGVLLALRERGHAVSGMDLWIEGNIPDGAGLSSSAALEVLTGVAARDLFGLEVSMTELARIGQYAENHFVGCSCGIMDQFASAMGKKDYAIFLDTATLDHTYVPLRLPEVQIVIVNSKVKHSLASSAYNERRLECAGALEELQAVTEIRALGDLTNEAFARWQDAVKDPVRRKRARHAVSENQRTIQAVQALEGDDLAAFGRLMNASHISLRDDYEVSCPELDLLTELAQGVPGVLGARMTGGGFGGCTVNLVKKDAVEHFLEVVGTGYQKMYGIKPEFYMAETGDGARRLPE